MRVRRAVCEVDPPGRYAGLAWLFAFDLIKALSPAKTSEVQAVLPIRICGMAGKSLDARVVRHKTDRESWDKRIDSSDSMRSG